MDRQVDVYLCVYMCFQELTQLGGCTIPVETKENDQGGSYEASILFTYLGGLKRISLQIADISIN